MSVKMTNSNKSSNTEEQKATKQQINEQNKSSDVSEATKDNEKPSVKASVEQPKDNKIGGGKCVVEYVGNSVWVDSNNDKWSRNDVKGTSIKSQRTYPAQEYESRDDLKFMVQYGEMKLTVVE